MGVMDRRADRYERIVGPAYRRFQRLIKSFAEERTRTVKNAWRKLCRESVQKDGRTVDPNASGMALEWVDWNPVSYKEYHKTRDEAEKLFQKQIKWFK